MYCFVNRPLDDVDDDDDECGDSSQGDWRGPSLSGNDSINLDEESQSSLQQRTEYSEAKRAKLREIEVNDLTVFYCIIE